MSADDGVEPLRGGLLRACPVEEMGEIRIVHDTLSN
jgi:hypothetical protein